MTAETNMDLPISPELLEILRDPLAVQDKETYGDDPGRLELVHNCWLISKDTGLKYPIKDGIPVMLIEEGQKWKDVDIDDLPVPPPPLLPDSPPSAGPEDLQQAQADDSGSSKARYIIPLLLALLLILVVWRATAQNHNEN